VEAEATGGVEMTKEEARRELVDIIALMTTIAKQLAFDNDLPKKVEAAHRSFIENFPRIITRAIKDYKEAKEDGEVGQ
jgi:hypothetical protein